MLGFAHSARRAICTPRLAGAATSFSAASSARLGTRGFRLPGQCLSPPPHPRIELSLSLLSRLPSSALASSSRGFQHLAPKDTPAPAPSPLKTPQESKPPGNTVDNDAHEPTPVEQRRSDWSTIKRLMVNVWPRNDWKTRGIVLFGFALLVSGKVGAGVVIGVVRVE